MIICKSLFLCEGDLFMFANGPHRDAIHRGARTLNQLGSAMGKEIDSQNKHIDRIMGKTDKVDDQIAVNRARLDRIK